MMMNSTGRLVLASGSPRRKMLLEQCGFQFEVEVRDFPEDFPDDIAAHQVAEYLAVQKNKNYRKLFKNDTIITADTTVINGSQVLNKPQNQEEAISMILSYSGHTHQVVSGVCISSASQTHSFSDITEVTFHEISKEEAEYYVTKYAPMDKAGAYGIQEWIGLTKVKELKGSFYNVMGLPTHQLYHVLVEVFGINPLR